MKTNFKRTFLMVGLACAVTVASAAIGSPKKKGKSMDSNPLMQKSPLPYGAPDFSKIKDSHYLPAIKAGIAEQRAEIKRIVENKQKPTFENTILAYEKSGQLLNRVTNVFFGVTEANKSPEIEAAEKEAIPLLTDFDNEVNFNKKFFDRVKYVYDHQLNSLKGEDKKLLEEMYKGFVRSGALLPKDKMDRMVQINKRLAVLQQDFGNMLPKAAAAATVWVNDVKELAGLSTADIAQCKKDAESRGGKAPYCIVITNTTQQPILASLDNRQLRERVFNASIHRTDGTGEFNTFPFVAEIAKLRAEKAELMGYKNYASYSLDNAMAKNTDNTYAFLKQLIKEYQPKAEAETKAIEEYARKTQGADFKLQPYDRFYYSAKMKKDQYNFLSLIHI